MLVRGGKIDFRGSIPEEELDRNFRAIVRPPLFAISFPPGEKPRLPSPSRRYRRVGFIIFYCDPRDVCSFRGYVVTCPPSPGAQVRRDIYRVIYNLRGGGDEIGPRVYASERVNIESTKRYFITGSPSITGAVRAPASLAARPPLSFNPSGLRHNFFPVRVVRARDPVTAIADLETIPPSSAASAETTRASAWISLIARRERDYRSSLYGPTHGDVCSEPFNRTALFYRPP